MEQKYKAGWSEHFKSGTINDKFGEFTLFPADILLADQTKGLSAQSGKISSFLRH